MDTKNIVYTAIFIALGIVLPISFHYLGTGLGAIFLPMHIPVLLGGALLGPLAGIIIGAITPVLSSVFTGMPPLIPMVPIMFLELALYGFFIGYLYRTININLYVSLILTMIAGRIGSGIMVWVLVNIFSISKLPGNPLLFIWGSIVKGLPGIAIQLILIPLVLKYLYNYQGLNPVNENV